MNAVIQVKYKERMNQDSENFKENDSLDIKYVLKI